MPSSVRYMIAAAILLTFAHALNDIVVPSSITAEKSFQATFQDANSDSYRVFLAAAVTGTQGPMCYLSNSTSLSSPVDLTIPAAVGPDASYYSIAIADLTTNSASTYSNRFNFTGGTGTPTQYEEHLKGAPFWDANKLPCSAMSCARTCANASYPGNLQEGASYKTLKNCILQCPGVEADNSLHAADGSPSSIAGAIVTLKGGAVVTALETVVGGTTEAIVGSTTLVLGSAAATVSSGSISLESSGLAVDGTTTVAFSNIASATSSGGSAASGTTASGSSSTSSGGSGPVITGAPRFVAAVGAVAALAVLAL